MTDLMMFPPSWHAGPEDPPEEGCPECGSLDVADHAPGVAECLDCSWSIGMEAVER